MRCPDCGHTMTSKQGRWECGNCLNITIKRGAFRGFGKVLVGVETPDTGEWVRVKEVK